MDDGDHDSLLWSSDDTKSNDLSIVTTTTDLEENYFASPIVSIWSISIVTLPSLEYTGKLIYNDNSWICRETALYNL